MNFNEGQEMSKRTEKADQKPPAEAQAEKKPERNPEQDVPPHRMCPTCWGRLRGVGTAQGSKGMTTNYKCTTCGHHWTVTWNKETVVLQHKTVEMMTR